MTTIAIVRQNSDFTEGKGSMLFHKAFITKDLAHNYIMTKSGIFGSTQSFSSEYNGVFHYNGYSIEIIPLEDKILSKEEIKNLEEELEQITNRQREIKGLLT